MTTVFAERGDIDGYIELVRSVRLEFPGLETEESLKDHEATALKFIGKRQALCVKENGSIIAVMLFSRSRNMICFLAVLPQHRRKGAASALMEKALGELDNSRDITVSTFCKEDTRGKAPRALYRHFGFVEGEFTVEFGCLNQVFVLHADGR